MNKRQTKSDNYLYFKIISHENVGMKSQFVPCDRFVKLFKALNQRLSVLFHDYNINPVKVGGMAGKKNLYNKLFVMANAYAVTPMSTIGCFTVSS